MTEHTTDATPVYDSVLDAVRAVGQMTRAVTIDSPVEDVWPWLAQVGQDRGAFYSYDWLENLAGCRLKIADRVHLEWQHRAVGDTVLLHPAAGIKQRAERRAIETSRPK